MFGVANGTNENRVSFGEQFYRFEHVSFLDHLFSGRVWVGVWKIYGSLPWWLAGSRDRGQILGRCLVVEIEQLKAGFLDNSSTDANV